MLIEGVPGASSEREQHAARHQKRHLGGKRREQRDHHDPIEGLKKTLIENGKTEGDLKAIDKAIRARVAEAADFAENSPEPAPEELYTEVLVGEYS